MTLPDLKHSHSQIIHSIRNTQNTETYLYQRLKQIMQKNPVDEDEKRKILSHIKELQVTRETQFDILQQLFQKHNGMLNAEKEEIGNSIEMIDVVNDELKFMKEELKDLKYNHMKKKREVEIERYEQLKYAGMLKTVKFIAYVLGFSLIFHLVGKQFLPGSVVRWGTAVTIIIILLRIIYFVYDMYRRDNIYYDKYNFGGNYTQMKEKTQ